MGPGVGTGIALPATHPVPMPHYPGYTPPATVLSAAVSPRVAALEEYGRGAHIRRPTLFMSLDLRVPGYDREL